MLVPHRRDGLIEWMKGMLMHSFVLNVRNVHCDLLCGWHKSEGHTLTCLRILVFLLSVDETGTGLNGKQ